jgi:putative endonuclease
MARKYTKLLLLWRMTTSERGRWGETLAVIHLEKQNTRILTRNWRWKRYEIDLIGRSGATWVFVEVKVRKWGFGDSGVEAVDSQKQERIIQAAHHFLRMHDIDAPHIRFDIVSIEYNRHARRINHIVDAFICLPT